MAPPCQQKLCFRKDSTFSEEESKFIILKYGEVKCSAAVRRAFGTKFFPKKNPQQVQFRRVIDRFLESASVRPMVPTGFAPTSDESVQQVRDFFLLNPKAHIREAAARLGMSYSTVWKILRKILKWRAYTPHLAQVLSPTNMESRLAACNFWLTFTEEQFERILWSDEKWFVLHQAPNRKNDVRWGPADPNQVALQEGTWGKGHGLGGHCGRASPPGPLVPGKCGRTNLECSRTISGLSSRAEPQGGISGSSRTAPLPTAPTAPSLPPRLVIV